MRTLAAVDIGSNAMRLAVGSLEQGEALKIIENSREAVRLGHDVFAEGVIHPDTEARALEALKKFKVSAKKLGCEQTRIVATSAVREARNRLEFSQRVHEETGVPLEIIDGQEEARLVHLAVSSKLPLAGKQALLIDIGGGSVELTFTKDGNVVFSDSVKMGTVRLLRMFEERGLTPDRFTKLVRQYVKGIHRRLDQEVEDTRMDVCIGTGGNVEALVDACGGKRDRAGVGSVQLQKLEDYISAIAEMPLPERISRYKLRPDRADVIVPAGVVLIEVMKHVGAKELISPNVGLKDGILLDMAEGLQLRKPELEREQLLAFTKALGARYQYDQEHAQRVADHALALFDQTKERHKLGSRDRLLLEVAALLHDIGTVISVNGHHKHSQYLISQSLFVGLSQRERMLVALVARYHRKSLPKPEHADYQALPEKDKERVSALASFLRLAEAIEQQHARTPECRVKLRWEGRQAVLSIEGSGDRALEGWAAAQRADLFEKVFSTKLLIEKP